MYHDSPKFARLVQEEIEKWKITGLSVAVIQGDKVHTKVSRPYTYFPSGYGLAFNQSYSGIRLCDSS
jgi:CubicO group peptidase (beta-lactamase class C family)